MRAFCYPLALDRISNEDIVCWLFELEQNRLLRMYAGEDGVAYLYLVNWEKHQRVRNKRSRYPQPPAECQDLRQFAADCGESQRDAPARAESESESESLSESNIHSPIPAESDDKHTSRQDVFEHWNQAKIIQHRALSDKLKRSINGALATYSQAEIIQAIDNYAWILASPVHYFKYRWTLGDFLQRGLDKFMNRRVADANYKNDNSRGSARRLPEKYTAAPDYRDRPNLKDGTDV